MYAVGSKVVHAVHGAATIAGIEEKSLGDTSGTYYVLDCVAGARAMTLMVPVGEGGHAGLRRVGSPARLLRTLASCRVPPDEDIPRDFRVRQATMTERLKSGLFKEVTRAVRSLFFLGTQRNLGVVDRRMLDRGRQIMASELAVAFGIEMCEALDKIEANLERMAPIEEELLSQWSTGPSPD